MIVRRAGCGPLLFDRHMFSMLVLNRLDGRCVVCGEPAVDAHHLIDRSLFDDGGYYLENGVGLCSECHLLAEYCVIDPDDLREMADMDVVLLPGDFDGCRRYDKWGNVIGDDGARHPGPLFHEERVQKSLRQRGRIKDFHFA